MDELKNKNIEEVLKSAGTHLTTVGDARGIMTIFVKCTIDLCARMENASLEIQKFNKSTTRLTKVMIALTALLAIATFIGAYATYKIYTK